MEDTKDADLKEDKPIRALDMFPYHNNFDMVQNGRYTLFVLTDAGIYVVSRHNLLNNEKLEYRLLDTAVGLNKRLESLYGKSVQVVAKYNVSENDAGGALQELVDEKCDLIFATSYGFQGQTKEFAQKYPDIQFCMATGDNANEEPVLPNYHTFMGEIYQGRYLAGAVAGMKLEEMIQDGRITPDQAKIGYVGAYPYPEVMRKIKRAQPQPSTIFCRM